MEDNVEFPEQQLLPVKYGSRQYSKRKNNLALFQEGSKFADIAETTRMKHTLKAGSLPPRLVLTLLLSP